MDFYQVLLDHKITVRDLTDAQLEKLSHCWLDDKNNVLPVFDIFCNAQDERRRREVERAWKPKPIDRGFFS
jgi:hypothetical protein